MSRGSETVVEYFRLSELIYKQIPVLEPDATDAKRDMRFWPVAFLIGMAGVLIQSNLRYSLANGDAQARYFSALQLESFRISQEQHLVADGTKLN